MVIGGEIEAVRFTESTGDGGLAYSDGHDGIALSIVVPCYKSERYLKRCLDSLLVQTFKSIEVICVNDGSPDGSLAIMRRYEHEHPDVVRVIDQQNAGLWNARWSGTDVARGTYVTYVDSDDYVDSVFAEEFVTTAEREDADVVVCGFRRTVEETGTVVSTEMDEARPSFLPASDPGRLLTVNPAAWNKAFRRDLLVRMRRLVLVPPILEDVALSELAFLAARRCIAFTGRASYVYLVHEGSMINTVTPKQVEAVKEMLLEVRRDYELDSAGPEMLAYLDAAAFLHLGVSMSFRLSSCPGVDLTASIRETTDYLDRHFPTWRHSPYMTRRFAFANGGALKKLWAARFLYGAHLMPLGLSVYRFIIDKLHKDIKW